MKRLRLSFIPASIAVVLVIVLTAYGCRKKKNDDAGPDPGPIVTCKHSPRVLSDTTCNLSGAKLWHRAYRRIYVMYSDTAYSLPDTSFSLSVLNSTTVVASGDTFYYNTDSSINGRLYYDPKPGVYGPLVYKYAIDSIAFVHWININSATREYITFSHP